MGRRVLYLTLDGLLQPLGFSQVARIVMRLAKSGWQYRVISLEKPQDLERRQEVARVGRLLRDAGVEWRYLPYDWAQTSRAALQNMGALIGEAVQATRRGDFDLVHAWAFHGGVAAHAAWLATGTRYVYDTRSYWIDERIEEGRWFTTPGRVAVARGVEHRLFASASGVVTLTELQADDVREGRFGSPAGKVVQCIPTCADFDDFALKPRARWSAVSEAQRAALKGALVLGIVGALNRSYLVDETLALCRRVLALRRDAQVLVLSSQREVYLQAARDAGIDLERLTIVNAAHDAMPEWLSLIDFGMLLLQPHSQAKRASMPTKLAEFFAVGVRPVQFGCNVEVQDWVRKSGTGVIVKAVSDDALDEAARTIAECGAVDLALGRARTEKHFSLETGADRYNQLLAQVLSQR